MADTLFLLGEGGTLKTMSASDFPSEDIFQALLANHPQLLTDADFGEDTPRRWALVKREAGVPDLEGGSSRWSLDHLFLDQDGVPTLVEIKRATDTRARREVVAQMLDYAANAVSYWRIDDLVEDFSRTAERDGTSAEGRLSELLVTDEPDKEAFWRAVQANLKSGRIRMIFVADRIAPELVRIVEFMNEQMSPAVVVALELRPFENGTDRIISPRLIGQTSRARATKAVSEGVRKPTYNQWLNEALSASEPTLTSAKRFVALLAKTADRLTVSPSQTLCAGAGSKPYNAFYIQRNGRPSVGAFAVKSSAVFADPQSRRLMLQKLQKAGVQMSKFDIEGQPTMSLPALDDAPAWSALESVVNAVFQSLRLDALQPELSQ